MSNKKVMMSVTAGVAIASSLAFADEAEAASYKVQSGDSLWSIAQKHNTSVSKLLELNNLKSDLIFPNQVLKVDGEASTTKKSSSNSNSNSSASSSSSANTYTVKSGDTLSGIAAKHGISLNNLMKWNNLNTTLIYPGNVLAVSANGGSSKSSSSSSSGSSSSKPKQTKVSSSTVYTVKSGDTLSRIGAAHGVSVANLKKWNNLNSDLIFIGQKLNIGSSKSSSSGSVKASSTSNSSKATASVDYNVDKLISVAKSQAGTRYVWGGSKPGGFDCSGFIYYVYNQAGKDISRLSSGGYYNRSYHVNNPQVGDLVFFAGTYKSGISHLGVYLGNNQFIHAGSSGVQISSLSSSYWSKHFDSFKRFY